MLKWMVLATAMLSWAVPACAQVRQPGVENVGESSPATHTGTNPDCKPDYDIRAMHLLADVEAENRSTAIMNGVATVDLPGGEFQMGCSVGDSACDMSEMPVHPVDVPAFAIGRYDVTVDQFRSFVEATGYRTDAEKNTGDLSGCYVEYAPDKWDYRAGYSWRNPGFSQGGNDPVVCVSWNDAKAYTQWLSRATGRHFRLPSEAEWEYAARGGTGTRYYWGETADHAQANYGADSCCTGKVAGPDRWEHTSPSGSFPPNGYGLFDMIGNVRQWMADCVHEDYENAPRSASARTGGDCGLRVVRNGSWIDTPKRLRVSARDAVDVFDRLDTLGFRVVLERSRPGDEQ